VKSTDNAGTNCIKKTMKYVLFKDNIMMVNIRRGDACSTSGGNYKCTKILITKTEKATDNGGQSLR
jgi:hypothetical protein